ncbi:MAG: phenol degradation protein meta [Desulfuromonas sp.]|nr:MAG: phenol degradation protein meta [Desulfuromonas sp.]
MRHLFLALAVAALPLFAGSPVAAYDQPSVNLGFTSFLDGGPPAGPGFYATEYLQYYTADKLADMPIPDPELDVLVSLNQLLYQSDQPLLLGGKWGLDVIVPIVSFDSNPLPENGAGLGDIVIGPYLQWDPVMGEKGPLFMQRVEFQFILPTGRYDNDKALNPGSNYFSFNPYWAATLFLGPKLTASWRLHYLWNAKNDDPFVGYGADDLQAGQAVHGNFAMAYEVVPKMLRLGVNGYFFNQISKSKIDGDKVSGKEKVFAIGPGALLSLSQDTHIFFNAYFESSAEQRPEGERYLLRLVHHF